MTQTTAGMNEHILKVERKFLVTQQAVDALRAPEEQSMFSKIKAIDQSTMNDKYYEYNDSLFDKGVYVRQRNGAWEAKVRIGSDYLSSALQEVSGEEAVKEVVNSNLHLAIDGVSLEDALELCAEYTTERQSWVVDDKFRVDVDSTDFGHSVGEVELLQKITSEEDKTAMRQQMNEDIEEFLKRYVKAFPEGKATSKLTAYFAWKKSAEASGGRKDSINPVDSA